MFGMEITSTQNPKLKEVVRLRQERQRKKGKKILVDGVREVYKATRAGFRLEGLFVDSTRNEGDFPADLFAAVDSSSIFRLPGDVFGKIAFGERNEGVVAVFHEKKKSLFDLQLSKAPLILILDGIEKPGNVGAVFRSASAAGVDAIILTNEVCSPFNANAIRSSLGTVFELQFANAMFSEAVKFLADNKIDVVTTRVDSKVDYTEFDFTQSIGIVLGSEAQGVAAEWNQYQSVIIPMQSEVDSLNISATAAVVAFEARRQRRNS